MWQALLVREIDTQEVIRGHDLSSTPEDEILPVDNSLFIYAYAAEDEVRGLLIQIYIYIGLYIVSGQQR